MISTSPIKDLFLSFFRLGLTAFGGPAMVVHIRELSVGRRHWLDERDFKNGLALCQSIPGATAIQAAAYVGLKTGGVAGALASYVGFGLPAFLLMLVLSILYGRYNGLPESLRLFSGLQVIVVAIILNAIYAFGKSNVKNIQSAVITILSTALFWQGISPFLIVIGAGLAGVILLQKARSEPPSPQTEQKSMHWEAGKILLLNCLLLAALAGLYFADAALFALAAVMLKIDLFAFGGGFASLPLMLHEIVLVKGWMAGGTFMDGVALGQVTPGPIVITAAFVGYWIRGLEGAVVSTVAIFTPSFLMVITLAPVFDRLRSTPYFSKVIDGILASFVGLLIYVLIKFAFTVPWDVVRIILGLAALAALLRKVDILYIVPAGAILSVIFL
ncbi:MAG: Chromate transport protein [Syntrophaceae bacterium PtaU1.Bin231]|nr:MAG: Chromate transport protein [Syntrophaceae bacterium PtaU1.Bin231]